jgi:hypothetical protein
MTCHWQLPMAVHSSGPAPGRGRSRATQWHPPWATQLRQASSQTTRLPRGREGPGQTSPKAELPPRAHPAAARPPPPSRAPASAREALAQGPAFPPGSRASVFGPWYVAAALTRDRTSTLTDPISSLPLRIFLVCLALRQHQAGVTAPEANKDTHCSPRHSKCD